MRLAPGTGDVNGDLIGSDPSASAAAPSHGAGSEGRFDLVECEAITGNRAPSVIAILTNAFPLWVLAASLLALWRPELFTWFTGGLITVGLAVIMLGMGLTLGFNDVRRVSNRRLSLGLGVALQYTVMPSLGWALARLYDLPTPFAVGLILVSCCPGGTASNVIAFLARVDVALSVTMTAASTIMAIVMTPVLTALLAGSRIDVPMAGLLMSTVQVVALPLLAAGMLSRWAPRVTRVMLPVSPLVAVVMITLIVASIIGDGREAILAAGPRLLLAIASLHACGFLFGYFLIRATGANVATARTIAIEVGMQNSGLGVVLARSNFANPLVAIPSAISSLFHSLIASALTAWWRRSPVAVDSPAVVGGGAAVITGVVLWLTASGAPGHQASHVQCDMTRLVPPDGIATRGERHAWACVPVIGSGPDGVVGTGKTQTALPSGPSAAGLDRVLLLPHFLGVVTASGRIDDTYPRARPRGQA